MHRDRGSDVTWPVDINLSLTQGNRGPRALVRAQKFAFRDTIRVPLQIKFAGEKSVTETVQDPGR